MTQELLFRDVNLAEIVFSGEGQELNLSFLNMSDGSEVGRLKCQGLLALEYHTTISPLPLYVGEVNHDEFEAFQATEMLRNLKYSFCGQSEISVHPPLGRLHHLQIEGGEICIQVVCEGLTIYGKSKQIP
jgi:hypothetical protein